MGELAGLSFHHTVLSYVAGSTSFVDEKWVVLRRVLHVRVAPAFFAGVRLLSQLTL